MRSMIRDLLDERKRLVKPVEVNETLMTTLKLRKETSLAMRADLV